MKNGDGVNVAELPAPINRLGQQDVGGGMVPRREQRQAKRDEGRRLREQVFLANQKVTRGEMQQLMNAVVDLTKEVSDYKGFVRNIFFVLEHKGMVSLKEMDEIAKIKTQEAKDFQEISKNDNIPLSEKIEIAKQKGLSQVFIEMLSAPEQTQV